VLFHSCLSNLNQNSNFELKCQERHFATTSGKHVIESKVDWSNSFLINVCASTQSLSAKWFSTERHGTIKIKKRVTTGRLQLTGQNNGRVFNFRNGRVNVVHFLCYEVKLPKLKLKTQPKQFLGSLPLDIALPRMRQLTHRLVALLLLLVSPTSCQTDDALKASCWLAGCFWPNAWAGLDQTGPSTIKQVAWNKSSLLLRIQKLSTQTMKLN
jgi:hypothetical protein